MTTVPQVQVGVDLPIRATFTVNEEQSLTPTGTWTAGSFTLTSESGATTPLRWNSTAADLQAALNALPNLTPDGVTVTGGPLPGAPVYITFTGGDLAGRDATPITADTTTLTGTAPGLTIATTRAGGPTDPTAITFTITEPDGAATTYTTPDAHITKKSAGTYEVTWRVAKQGHHAYRWASTATGQGAATDGGFYALT